MIGKSAVACSVVFLLLAMAAPSRADIICGQSRLQCGELAPGTVPGPLPPAGFGPGSLQVFDDFAFNAPAAPEHTQGSPSAESYTGTHFLESVEASTPIADLEPGLPGASAGGGSADGSRRQVDVWAYDFQRQDAYPLDGGFTQYASVDTGRPAEWAWLFGTHGNDGFETGVSDSDQWQQVPPTDPVYDPGGTVVPEPATITLLVLGLAGYFAKRGWRGGGT